MTNATVGAGCCTSRYAAPKRPLASASRSTSRPAPRLNSHKPAVVWFTGLSGAGKSSIANITEKKLHAEGIRTYMLDGDNVRHGLNKISASRRPTGSRTCAASAEVARLMVEAGLVVLVAFISPFRDERRGARERVADGEFCEVFVDTPLEVAEQRDVKGLYAKARSGQLVNFTGIDSPYEPPENPEVHVDTQELDPDAAADRVIAHLRQTGVLG